MKLSLLSAVKAFIQKIKKIGIQILKIFIYERPSIEELKKLYES